MPKPFLALPLLFALLLPGASALAESCTEETLLGPWVTAWDKTETWTFVAGGGLLCDGFCDYGSGVGRPKAWAYEPDAYIWSRPLDHLKLIFSERRFEGAGGAFRCDIERSGSELRLEPLQGEALRLNRP